MKPILVLTALLASAAAAPQPFLIGTNTGGKSGSKGIYASSFDPETGKLGEVRLVAEADNPGFLAFHPELPVVYATGRKECYSFRFAPDGELTPINRVPNGANGGCHLEVDPTGRGLAVANYNDGSLSTFRLGEDGSIQGPAHVTQHEGSSVHPRRQKAPHAHGTHFLGDLLLVPDLGMDRVLAYRFDPAEDVAPRPAEPAFVATEPGGGPRHAAFHPSGRFVFVNHEMSAKLEAFRLEGAKMTSTSLVPTLPEDHQGPRSTAEVEVHPNGRWVFVSNRGHDSIAVFAFDSSSGALTPSSVVSCGAKIPRHFTLSPDSRRLLVAGQRSDDIHVMNFDAESGVLTPTDESVSTPSPICLKFLPQRD